MVVGKRAAHMHRPRYTQRVHPLHPAASRLQHRWAPPPTADNRYGRFLAGYRLCVEVLLEGGADPLLRADATGPVTVLGSHPRSDLWEAVLRRRLHWLLASPAGSQSTGGTGQGCSSGAAAADDVCSGSHGCQPLDRRPSAQAASAVRWLGGLSMTQAADLLFAAAAVGEPEQAAELVRLAAPLTPAQAEVMLRTLADWHRYTFNQAQVRQAALGFHKLVPSMVPAAEAGRLVGPCGCACRCSLRRACAMLCTCTAHACSSPLPVPCTQAQLVCCLLDACEPGLSAAALASADLAQQGLEDLLCSVAEVPHLGAVQRLLALGAPLAWDTLLTAARHAARKRREEDSAEQRARPSRFVLLVGPGEGAAEGAEEEAAPVPEAEEGAAVVGGAQAAAAAVPAASQLGRDPPEAWAALEVLRALLRGAAALPQPELGTPEAAVELEDDSCAFAWLAARRTQVSTRPCTPRCCAPDSLGVIHRVCSWTATQHTAVASQKPLPRPAPPLLCPLGLPPAPPPPTPTPPDSHPTIHAPPFVVYAAWVQPCCAAVLQHPAAALPALHACRAAPRTGPRCTASGAWWRRQSCCWRLGTAPLGWPGPGTCPRGRRSRCCCGTTARLTRRWRRRARSCQGGIAGKLGQGHFGCLVCVVCVCVWRW